MSIDSDDSLPSAGTQSIAVAPPVQSVTAATEGTIDFVFQIGKREVGECIRMRRCLRLLGTLNVVIGIAVLSLVPLTVIYLLAINVRVLLVALTTVFVTLAGIAMLLHSLRYWRLATAIDHLGKEQTLASMQRFITLQSHFWQFATTLVILAIVAAFAITFAIVPYVLGPVK